MLLPGARSDTVWCAPDEGSDAWTTEAAGSQPRPRDPGAVLGVPSSGRTGGSSGPSLHRVVGSVPCDGVRDAPGVPRIAPIPMRTTSPGVTPELSQWRPRLGMASRERWGRPDRAPGPGGDRPGPSGPRSSQVTGARGGSGRSRDPVGLPTLGSDHGTDHQGGQPHRMLRLLHTADVHLGARHADLGEAAAAQRERQFAAFRRRRRPRDRREGRPVPRRRRPVRLERPAQALGGARGRRARPARAGPDPLGAGPGHPRRLRPLVGLPRLRPRGHGGHAAGRGRWSPSSRRTTRGSTSQALDAVVHGPCFPTKRAPRAARCATSPPSRRPTPPGSIGVLHASVAIPGRTDHDEVVVTVEEIAASGLDYLALGHWHSRAGRQDQGRHLRVRGRAGAGRRRPGQGRQGAAGDARRRQDRRSTPWRSSSATSARRRSSGARSTRRRSESQPALVDEAHDQGADPDLVLDVRAHRRPARRARPRHRRRSRQALRAIVPAGARPRREPPGPDRGRAAARGDDRRRVHPQRRGADRRPRGDRRRHGPRARPRSCATCSGSAGSCSRAREVTL